MSLYEIVREAHRSDIQSIIKDYIKENLEISIATKCDSQNVEYKVIQLWLEDQLISESELD
jgi:hypothetical protein